MSARCGFGIRRPTGLSIMGTASSLSRPAATALSLRPLLRIWPLALERKSENSGRHSAHRRRPLKNSSPNPASGSTIMPPSRQGLQATSICLAISSEICWRATPRPFGRRNCGAPARNWRNTFLTWQDSGQEFSTSLRNPGPSTGLSLIPAAWTRLRAPDPEVSLYRRPASFVVQQAHHEGALLAPDEGFSLCSHDCPSS